MLNLQVILLILAGGTVIIAVLFFPLRWLLLRFDERAKTSPKVSVVDVLKLIPILILFFIVAWYMEADNSNAAVLFAVMMLGINIACIVMLSRVKEKSADDDAV